MLLTLWTVPRWKEMMKNKNNSQKLPTVKLTQTVPVDSFFHYNLLIYTNKDATYKTRGEYQTVLTAIR